MTESRENRQHERTPLRTSIRITHESFGELLVDTRDISYGGVFLLTAERQMPPIGTIIEGQVQDDYAERPIVRMQIVRIESNGVGVMFID
ncbi:MAG: PilZ domain-containing protein [Gammaproteobacteria bacterium]|nr:PilZ domain-containing protein [Gammaproteobacteria bacterium]MCB1853213.1 PilZ domain-containing protein [Gammaproteobacteria bacterium]MCP5416753.1 PilZ domain-containing protein [Chromatiaceae bacterium]